jgi:hypothetical protein
MAWPGLVHAVPGSNQTQQQAQRAKRKKKPKPADQSMCDIVKDAVQRGNGDCHMLSVTVTIGCMPEGLT